jgi:anti-anti-sigma regulatory factor
MIRLRTGTQTPEEVVLEVHGWVSSGRNVEILEQEGTRLLEESERLVLDLKGVQFIDREGIALLQRWWGERLVLRNGSPFVRMLLETYGLA